MEIESLPSEIDEVQRRMMQLEIEREALKKEKDSGSKERLKNLNKEIEDLKVVCDEKKAHWHRERDAIQAIQHLKEKIEEARSREERAERNGAEE